MRKWVSGLGYVLVAIGLASYTPLGEFFPIDPFSMYGREPYRRVVASTSLVDLQYVLIGCIGLVLVLVTKLLGTRKDRRENE